MGKWLALAGLLASAAALDARVIVVAPGADAEERAQEALIEAKPGDTVRFAAGTFRFVNGLSLDVDGVTVEGEGQEKTVLDFSGQATAGDGLLVTSDRVLLRQLTVRDTKGDGIKSKGSDRVTFQDLTVEWSGGPKPSNGAYGVYPVSSTNVLVERVTVRGASDAGIYVGQSRNIIVRDSLAEFNVAGIEIENSMHADVFGNTVTRNTGGILVFDLPNLPQMGGHSTRIFANRVVNNDTPNFAPEGNIVASVPVGTGIMVMANRNVHVFENEVDGNASAAFMVIAYSQPFESEGYNPLPREVVIRDNRVGRNGFAPAFPGGAEIASAVGGTLPPGLWDGVEAWETAGRRHAERALVHFVGTPAISLNLPVAGAPPAEAKPAPAPALNVPPPAQPVPVVLPADQPGS
ncbi:MAG: parallel beta-helix domain-containing protein [Sphingomonadaceae bacterium]